MHKDKKLSKVFSIDDVKPYKEIKQEKYMNELQLNHFKNILEKWRDQLQFEIKNTEMNIQDETTNFPDPIDRATQEEEFNLKLRNRDREYKLIKKIEKTLQKIANDNFGYCDTCGVEIGLRRLEARPTADLCIDCKTIAEIREKQMAG